MNNFEDIIVGVGTRAQTIEDAIWGVYTEMGLTLDADDFVIATGAQLDLLGKLVGLPRSSLSDADYTAFLKMYGKILVGSGTIPQLISMLEILFPSDLITVEEVFPAGFIIHILNSSASLDFDPAILVAAVRKARGAGIRGEVHYSLHPPATTFTLDGTANQSLDLGHFSTSLA